MLRVYLKPTCSTCRALVELLDARGVEYEGIDYYVDPIGEDRLRELIAKSGRGARELLRTRDRPELATSAHTDDELIAMIVEDPDLVLRPIVELGDRALVARPPGRVLELLDDAG
jgi:arsenate reductase